MEAIPNSLRTWFVIHFAVDMLVGIFSRFFSEYVRPLFGWNTFAPIASSVVGKLNLKVIGLSSAILGIGLGIWQGSADADWLFLEVF